MSVCLYVCSVCVSIHVAFKKLKIYVLLLIYFWLCWVLVASWGLPPVAVSGGYSLLQRTGFSFQEILSLRRTGSGCWGLVAVAQGLSGVHCSRACGIFPDQGLNLCLLALTGEFLTTAPPGKSSPCLLYVCMCLCLCVCVSVHVCVCGCIEEKGSVCPCSVWSQMLWKGLALPITAWALPV